MTLNERIFDDLDDPDWLRMFKNVQRSWFRLETLQVYSVDYERDEYDRFLASGRLDRPVNDWQRMISRHTNAGRLLQRVHVVIEPLSDYLRYELAAYQLNSQAGEDIRVIPVGPHSWPAGLPAGRDYWLLDDRQVWDMHYNSGGRFLKAIQSQSSQYLDQCRQWRDIALDQAITLADYLQTAA